MKQGIILFLVLLFSGPSWSAQTGKKPFSIEDYYRIKSISDVRLSPDGKTAAFTVKQYDLPRADKTSSIWVIQADGTGIRQMTSGESQDYSPRWSPDGKTLAFISSRDEKSRIYLLPLSGGEAKKLSDISTSISGLTWCPGSDCMIFKSDLFPECGADMDCNEKRFKALEEGPCQSHVADSLLYRHWDSWKDGTRTHILKVDLEGTVTDLTPGDFDSPEFSLSGGASYDLTPDGSTLVFSSKRVRNPASSTNSDIFMEAIREPISDNPRNLTKSNPAMDSQPVISPDGKFVAYLTHKIPDYEADLFRIGLIDLGSGKSELLTDSDNFDYWVSDIQWGHTGRRIYFTAQFKGDTPLYRLSIDSKTPEKLVHHETIDSWAVDPDETFVIYTHRSIGEPLEIYRQDLRPGARPERLTFLNETVMKEVDIRPAERFYVKGAGGADVQAFLIKPHDFDPAKKYPVILNVHGGPQGMWYDSFRGDWQVYPGAGYVVVLPNPHGSTGFGQAYTAQISGDWGGMVYEDIMKVTDFVEDLPYVDRDRIGAMGWSFGGYMMNWILGHTDRYECVASMMSAFDLRSKYGGTEELWFPEWDLKGTPWDSPIHEKFSPSNFVTSFKTPTLVITGERDYRIPYTQSLQLFTALQKMNVPSRLIVFKNSGHWPSWYDMALYYTAHLDWFHRYLGGDPPPWSVEDFAYNLVFDKETGERIDLVE